MTTDAVGALDADMVRGRFLRRYQRFFADVETNSGIVTAHCPNTGTMATLLNPGVEAWLTPARDPKRKLQWTLTVLGTPSGALALIDTSRPNKLVAAAIQAGTVAELAGYRSLRTEVPYGTRSSRIDILLEEPQDLDGPHLLRRSGTCHVEVKNVTMASTSAAGRADFPDAVTTRGLKHLHELADLSRAGARAVLFYLVSRTDCTRCGIASEIDPAYAAAVHTAASSGVEFLAYRLTIAPDRLTLGDRVSFAMP